jgi:Domain of unknown function (DUF4365)
MGVMYVRSLLAQAGVTNNEVPGGEDYLAVDIAAFFPRAIVTLQVKAGMKKPNEDGSISVPTTKAWRDKWAEAQNPVFLVYVRLEKNPSSQWDRSPDPPGDFTVAKPCWRCDQNHTLLAQCIRAGLPS